VAVAVEPKARLVVAAVGSAPRPQLAGAEPRAVVAGPVR
jgi:hypothetical protein